MADVVGVIFLLLTTCFTLVTWALLLDLFLHAHAIAENFLSYINMKNRQKLLKILALFAGFFVILTGCTREFKGVVTGKHYVPEHTMVTYIMVGNVLVPQTYFYDEEYWLESGKNEVQVTKRLHDVAELGDSIIVTKDSIFVKRLKPTK